MRKPPSTLIYTGARERRTALRREARIATVRFDTRVPIELVHLAASPSDHETQRWRRIGSATDLIAKVLLLDRRFRPANTNTPRLKSGWPQQDLTST
ncbi:MAG: hypothetical protein RLN70_07435 [Rhodospirillaceae bacterium]